MRLPQPVETAVQRAGPALSALESQRQALVEHARPLLEKCRGWIERCRIFIETPRSADAEPDDPMARWHALARRTLIAVGVFSVFVNLLMMTLPLYLFQLSDRVLTSRSLDTLVMLSIVARRLPLHSCAARRVAAAGARAAGDEFRDHPRRAGAGQHRRHRQGRRQHQPAGAAQPASGEELHRQPGDAAAVRRAAGAALFRGDLPHPSRPRLDRAALRSAADRHRAAEPEGDAAAARRSRR